MITKKALLAKMKGQIVTRTAHNMAVLENWDSLVAEAKALLISKGVPESSFGFDEAGNFTFLDHHNWMRTVFKPKVKASETGKFNVYSRDYGFERESGESLGQVSKLEVVGDNQFKLKTFEEGYFLYTLGDSK